MKRSINVTLERPDKKLGEDRYKSVNGDFTICIPQYISRPDGKPLTEIKVTFEGGE